MAKARTRKAPTRTDMSKVRFAKLGHALCKSLTRHQWEVGHVEVSDGLFSFHMDCAQCGSTRVDDITSKGALDSRSYTHEDDYIFKGVGKRPSISAMRAVLLKEFVTDDGKLVKRPQSGTKIVNLRAVAARKSKQSSRRKAS